MVLKLISQWINVHYFGLYCTVMYRLYSVLSPVIMITLSSFAWIERELSKAAKYMNNQPTQKYINSDKPWTQIDYNIC